MAPTVTLTNRRIVRNRFLLSTAVLLLGTVPSSAADWSLSGEMDLDHPSGSSTLDSVTFSDAGVLGDTEVGVNISRSLSGQYLSSLASTSLTLTGFVRNHDFGFKLSSTASGASSITDVNVTYRLSDGWSLVAKSPSSVLPNMALNGNFVVSATATSSGPNGYSGGQPLEFEVFGGISASSIFLDRGFLRSGVGADLNHAFGVQFAQSGQSRGEFSLAFKTNFFFGGPYHTTIDSGRTFKLQSMSFEDGTTPEDHGFDIVFDSGRISPNVLVPEPNSVLLLAAAAVIPLRRRGGGHTQNARSGNRPQRRQ